MTRRLRIVVRVRATGSRLSRFVTGSLAAHGVLVAAVLIVPMAHRRAAPLEQATVVALAGPIGGPAPVLPALAATSHPRAAPAAAPPPKEAHAVREVPSPKPKPKVKAPPSALPAAPAAAGAPAKASGEAGGTPAAATGVTATVGGGDASLGWYSAAVKAALESNWQKPFLEDQSGTYSVTVSFEIGRDGTVRDARVVQPSGVPSLDRSAMRAVLESSPLPALPTSWSDSVLPATMRFDLSPESP